MGKVLEIIQRIYLSEDRIRSIRNFPLPSTRFALNPAWKGDLYFLIYGCPKAYQEEFKFIRSQIAGTHPLQGDILDIGANIGIYSVYFSALLQEGYKVYAFEPVQEICKKLQENITTNARESKILAESLAVSDKVGTALISIEKNIQKDPGQSSLVSTNYSRGFYRLTIPTTTIDSYCDTRKVTPSFIKIDTEGNELQVILGGMKILKQHKPKLFFEVNNDFENAAKIFSDLLCPLGYTIFFHDLPRQRKTPVYEAIENKEITNGNWYAEIS